MKSIVIAGGTGFLGQRLAAHLQHAGYDITLLTRRHQAVPTGMKQLDWDGRSPGPWAAALEGATAVINLAGRSVNCRYNARNRDLILNSRIESTRVIGHAMAQCTTPPSVWLNASTATIYRHTFGPPWGEDGQIGADPAAKDAFSIEVAVAWEAALFNSVTPATRKVALRTAMVLGCDINSVLPMLRKLSRMCLGGSLAGGRQYVSWIHETDFCRAVEWLIHDANFSGPVNVAAPHPVTNAELMQTVRTVCGRRFGLPTPRLMLEVGAVFLRTETELIIKSRRVIPQKLLAAGFEFRFPQLHGAVEDINRQLAGSEGH